MPSRVEGYAAALVAVADAEGQLERVPDELFGVGQAVAGSDELRETLGDISIPASRRISVIEDLLAERASPTTLNLIAMLVSAGRTNDIAEIASEVLAQAAESRGEAVAQVRSAVPLSDDQQARLAEALTRASGRSITVQVVVDPDVLGGITAQIGDSIYDGSVKTRLDKMKERLG